jgi:hypothetical protein
MNNQINFIDGEYFYKSYNIIQENDKELLIKDIEDQLKNYGAIYESNPPRRTYSSVPESYNHIKRLSAKYYWKKLFQTVFYEVNTYYKNYFNSSPSLVNLWMDKVDFYTDEDIRAILYYDEDLGTYTDNAYHSHEYQQFPTELPISETVNDNENVIKDHYIHQGMVWNVVERKDRPSSICIVYLQNCDKKYGTLVKTKNGSLVVSGEENSLAIFNSKLFHTAIYPRRKESLKYPRYTIGFDFKKK